MSDIFEHKYVNIVSMTMIMPKPYFQNIISVLYVLLLKVNDAKGTIYLDTGYEDQKWGTSSFPQSLDSVLTNRFLFGVHSHSYCLQPSNINISKLSA